MNDVRLDPQQVPARAELMLAAELGEDAPGRPIYARPEPDDHDDGERAGRIKVGAVLTRRLHVAEAAETPAGAPYGNPLQCRPGQAPSVPIGSALLVWTDALDARGWRVYRVTPAGTVMYDEWIGRRPGERRARAHAAAGRVSERERTDQFSTPVRAPVPRDRPQVAPREGNGCRLRNEPADGVARACRRRPPAGAPLGAARLRARPRPRRRVRPRRHRPRR